MLRARLVTILILTAVLGKPAYSQFGIVDEPDPSPKLVRAGRLLDVKSGKYLLDQGILTDRDRIMQVGPWEQIQGRAPKEAVRIDLSRATVLPGLIDCHAHLLVSMSPHMDGGQGITTAVTLTSPEFRTLIGARHAREDLEAGITAARVLGHSGIAGDIALRDAIRAGLVPGPRLRAAGRKITAPGGQAAYLQNGLAKQILEQEFLTVSGPGEARKAVRENLAIGADIIKVAIDGGAGPFWGFRYLAPEDAKAATEDAHRLGLKVAGHATDRASIQTAIDAGVDSVEHAFQATDEQLQQMKDRNIFLVATDIPDNGGSPESKNRLQRAMRIGVKIAMGSDLWSPIPGKTYGEATLLELRALHNEGMPNADVIRSATSNAAELLGWADLMGDVTAGKLADMIAVAGDPLEDITTLEHAGFVMKGSKVVRNDFTNTRAN